MIVAVAAQDRIPSEHTGAARAVVVVRGTVIKSRLHFASGVMSIYEVCAAQADLDNRTSPSRFQTDAGSVTRRVTLQVKDSTGLRGLCWGIDAKGDRGVMRKRPAGRVQWQL